MSARESEIFGTSRISTYLDMDVRSATQLRPGDKFVNEISRVAYRVDRIERGRKYAHRSYINVHCTVVWAYKMPPNVEWISLQVGDKEVIKLRDDDSVIMGDEVAPDAPGLIPWVRRQVFIHEGMISPDHPKGGSLSIGEPGVFPPGTFKPHFFKRLLSWVFGSSR